MSGRQLPYASWSETEALIGRPVAHVSSLDPVLAADIRRKLEVLAFDCPLHYDEECARRHGYRTVVSPVSMTRVWATPAYWAPGEPPTGTETMPAMVAAAYVPGEGDTAIATNVRLEHFEPAYPGDTIEGEAILKSVERKTTRVGTGAFYSVETTYRNQHGEVVTVETVTLFRFQREDAPA